MYLYFTCTWLTYSTKYQTYVLVCSCQRRIIHGETTFADKRYVVYLIQSQLSKIKYDSWLCGGALISKFQVITSAGCLRETNNLYVIAGYRKYVNWKAIDYDPCTRERKNRILRTCFPKKYHMHSMRVTWMAVDIGMAIVAKEYDFNDNTWRLTCSYVPQPIKIGYEYDFQTPGLDVVAFGWGSWFWRATNDMNDPNSQFLGEMSGVIVSKNVCINSYNSTKIQADIKRHLLCVDQKGLLDGEGNLMDVGDVTRDECSTNSTRRDGGSCSDSRSNISYTEWYRQLRIQNSRRTEPSPAICQNDHGGPLVTWVGSEEVLIGIAVTSVVNSVDNSCKSPSLFTSMYCCGQIVSCLAAATEELRIACKKFYNLSIVVDFDEKEEDWQ